MSLPLAQSASKSELFHRLGLTPSVPDHERVHNLMLEEAASGRDRLSSNSANLTQHSMAQGAKAGWYRWDELSETSKHREILHIRSTASPITRPYYDYGRYRTQVNEENWVIRWYLWHSFRYRDNRDPKGKSSQVHVPPTSSGTIYNPITNTVLRYT